MEMPAMGFEKIEKLNRIWFISNVNLLKNCSRPVRYVLLEYIVQTYSQAFYRLESVIDAIDDISAV